MSNVSLINQTSYRLVNSKFPPIALFDDVADEEEFDVLFELQSLTNPRLQNEIGNINLLPKNKIPFGIHGCSYAVAPFTHLNPDGSRFSDGSFGMLYLADTIKTAICESKHHQEITFQKIEGLHYDSIIMRGLTCIFSGEILDITDFDSNIYRSDDYSQSRALGNKLSKSKIEGIQYRSVRNKGATCWGLMTPENIKEIKQTVHFEFVFNGKIISGVHKISKP